MITITTETMPQKTFTFFLYLFENIDDIVLNMVDIL